MTAGLMEGGNEERRHCLFAPVNKKATGPKWSHLGQVSKRGLKISSNAVPASLGTPGHSPGSTHEVTSLRDSTSPEERRGVIRVPALPPQGK